MNKFKIGYFYSEGSPYKQVGIDYLEKSLEKFSVKCIITKTQNFGNWQRNVAEKPKAILEQLNSLNRDESLVFLDADATVERWPSLFEQIPEEYDIAFHMLNWKTWYGYDTEFFELLSGTMFFRNNDKVKNLCREWHDQAIKSGEWEQKVLTRVLNNHKLSVWELPLEYTYIISRPGELEPLHKIKEPIIIHHQVSRKYKNKVLY